MQPGHSSSSGSGHSSASTSYSASLSLAQQQQQSHSKHGNQIPSAADISLLLSLGMGGLDASQLANLDLQKLAMYLVSIELELESIKTLKMIFVCKVYWHKKFDKFVSKKLEELKIKFLYVCTVMELIFD